MNPLTGPCETPLAIINNDGVWSYRQCEKPGTERPDVRPGSAVSEIYCDACYTEWKAAMDARRNG